MDQKYYFRLPNNERLAMKVFSLNNQHILKENKFGNSILFLSTRINENGDVDYSEGFSADIADGKINSFYITPLGEIMDSNLKNNHMPNKIILFLISCFLNTDLLTDTDKRLKDIAPYLYAT
ncbi:hypothetical protein [Rickettsia rhipicephali]|uniref:hypothetical protein n=1 Tax=Rickettsia rhipicephali TaxID=33992 RepID=UPI00031F625C|nr:hypothetical protein [Rickettsia rhipicephali]